MDKFTVRYMGGRSGDIEVSTGSAQTPNDAIALAEGLPPGSRPTIAVESGEALSLEQFRSQYGIVSSDDA